MKKHSISMEQFMELDYKMVIDPYVNTEHDEKGFVITCPDLPGIKVFGETLEEAFEELSEAKAAWYEMKEELEEEIHPPVIKTKPSGRLTARLPVFLHEKVIEFAEENNTSVNSALTLLVTEGFRATDFKALAKELKEMKKQIERSTPSIIFNIKDEGQSKFDLDPEFLRIPKKSRENHNRLTALAGSSLFSEEMTYD